MTPAEDADLLRAAADGDAQAFQLFVQRHEKGVYRLLRAMAPEEADAEDAFQDTFLAAWKNAGSFRGDGSARSWILTIARNAFLKAQRRRSGEPASYEPLEDLGLQAGWGASPDPLDGLVRRDLLRRALDSLQPEDRAILVLRELEGFSGEEVADMLGISLAAMKSRLHRARLRLMAAVRKESHV
ncbi:MAG: RNA polymerase sigma factor [Gemmatimonadota bacterium]